MKFASLCILAYKRPERLKECLSSLLTTLDYPAEIIVNLDGLDGNEDLNVNYLTHELKNFKISKLILNQGKNRGVGRAFQNCLGVAEGDYIVKIDTDLTFSPQWLSTMIDIFDKNIDIGSVSCFDYNKWDPNDSRFKPEENILQERDCCYIVKDFVSSIYAFRKQDLKTNILNAVIPDDGLHQSFGKMALTKTNMVLNTAFGVGKSTYISGTMDHPIKTTTFNEPFIFKV